MFRLLRYAVLADWFVGLWFCGIQLIRFAVAWWHSFCRCCCLILCVDWFSVTINSVVMVHNIFYFEWLVVYVLVRFGCLICC